MPTKPQLQSITIDRKISLGILWSMLASFVGGVTYMANLNSNLIAATETLKEVKIAIERNTSQIVKSDRTVAVLETVVSNLDRRLTEIEKVTNR
jgi:hypothetical protein